MAERTEKYLVKLEGSDEFADPRKLLKKIQKELGPSEYKVANRLPIEDQISILKSYYKLNVVVSEK